MILTNLPEIAGVQVSATLGMVQASTTLTRRVMKTHSGGMRSMTETGIDGLAVELVNARQRVRADIESAAAELKCEAVIGLTETLTRLGDNDYVLMMAGTAVSLDHGRKSGDTGLPVEAPRVSQGNVVYPAFAGQPAPAPRKRGRKVA